MKKKYINRMILLMFFCITVYNLAHPATPGLIELRNWKKSISGEFLAVMSVSMFISSPYFGALADNIGMKKIFIFMPFLYGCSQIFFGFVDFLPVVFIARIIAGIASGGTFAVAFGYVSQLSTKETKSKNIAKVSSAAVIGGAIGQKIGGMVAKFDTRYPFGLQFICGCLVSVLIFIILKEIVSEKKNEIKEKKNLNPFATFRYIGELDGYSKFFCFIIFLSNVGIYSYASALNYFFKFYVKVNSDTIGTFVMFSSLAAFIGTSLILVKLIAKYKKKSIHKIMIFIGIILMSIILYKLKAGTVSYILMTIYTMTYEVVRSLGNSIIAQRYMKEQGKILGIASAVGFLGNAAGSLSSGYLLAANSYLPFIVNIIIMTVVFILLLLNKSVITTKQSEE